MAHPTDPEAVIKKKKSGVSILIWGLLAASFVGLGGYGVTNFGGGVTSIGSVGDQEISTTEYARALQQEMRAFSAQIGKPITMQEAVAIGLDQRALQSLVARTALDAEAASIGLSVGDETVARAIMEVPAFKGPGGTFDRETYRYALQNSNLSEADFEKGIRTDEARSVLQGAVIGGFVAPVAVTDTIFAFLGEKRGFSLLRLGEADLAAPLAQPTDEELKAFYDANIAQFTRPEAKRISYVALLPEMIAKDMPVDEASLKKMYDDRAAEFHVPEKRLVERLVYPTEAEATAAKARLDAGTPFETLVADRGLTLDDIDLGDVSKVDLGAAGDAVFALTEPGIVGPVMSDLGPALFRMNGILAAQDTSFEDAKADLAVEIQTDAARRAIGEKVEAIDDALAGGATLEDLAKEQGMELGSIDYTTGVTTDDRIAGYTAFREAADKLTAEDYPAAIALDDGGIVALTLQEIVPAAPIPFDEAREAVTAAWHEDALAKALSARAAEISTAVAGGASLGSFGIVDVINATSRDGFVENTPASLLPTVFKLAEDGLSVVEGPGFVGLVQLDRIIPAETTSAEAQDSREALGAQVARALSQDAFDGFVQALQGEKGLKLDQTAINAVQAQIN